MHSLFKNKHLFIHFYSELYQNYKVTKVSMKHSKASLGKPIPCLLLSPKVVSFVSVAHTVHKHENFAIFHLPIFFFTLSETKLINKEHYPCNNVNWHSFNQFKNLTFSCKIMKNSNIKYVKLTKNLNIKQNLFGNFVISHSYITRWIYKKTCSEKYIWNF